MECGKGSLHRWARSVLAVGSGSGSGSGSVSIDKLDRLNPRCG